MVCLSASAGGVAGRCLQSRPRGEGGDEHFRRWRLVARETRAASRCCSIGGGSETLPRLGRVARSRDMDRPLARRAAAPHGPTSLRCASPDMASRCAQIGRILGRDRVKRLRPPCERLSACAKPPPRRWRPDPLLPGERLDARRSPTVSAQRRACPTGRLEPRVRSRSARVAANAALIAVSGAPTENISVPEAKHKHWTDHPVWRRRSLGNRIQPNPLLRWLRFAIDVVAISLPCVPLPLHSFDAVDDQVQSTCCN